jgi:hypothetical protein
MSIGCINSGLFGTHPSYKIKKETLKECRTLIQGVYNYLYCTVPKNLN